MSCPSLWARVSVSHPQVPRSSCAKRTASRVTRRPDPIRPVAPVQILQGRGIGPVDVRRAASRNDTERGCTVAAGARDHLLTCHTKTGSAPSANAQSLSLLPASLPEPRPSGTISGREHLGLATPRRDNALFTPRQITLRPRHRRGLAAARAETLRFDAACECSSRGAGVGVAKDAAAGVPYCKRGAGNSCSYATLRGQREHRSPMSGRSKESPSAQVNDAQISLCSPKAKMLATILYCSWSRLACVRRGL
ncbi:hypothetical protein AAFF_G00391390 [Aldrovandia affinis]|uniref:Uncharacterized protein n=1 Tax=Aldrovandia affinis TaxID=143900 RepID=A0AAD7WL73_9TELE|nr:hypothetical protein AAFF_G00391390 [Aldrovandia affinis]